MGNRLRSQRRGKGSFTFLATKKSRGQAKYVSLNAHQKESVLHGQVMELLTDRGRTGVLAKIVFEDNQEEMVVAAEGLQKGKHVEYGLEAEIAIGNVLPLKKIPEGCPIFAIERKAGDGGTLVLAAGLYALIMSKDSNKALVKLPSSKIVSLPVESRAMIGCCAGGGRQEKPLLKAGTRYHWMKSRRRHYPSIRGVAMNAFDHPFGGSQHHPGKSKSVSRHRPPGRKVGAIASKRTGRKKK
ncbi:50S ribosomal protein L2 [Candidatus Micrarchaeota archaeon]|nr:50S ribosomal protein L2 [Candidatus Micrarchaeota archaeon]MBU1930732.1 50S ribosomal protein L2 [Candidatus Micrarchaeota archaeon]